MYNIIRQGDSDQYGVNSYVIDTADDVATLPKTCAAGSTCFCIATSAAYMFGNDGEWHEI